MNSYFEPFKLKKVTLELDEQKLFAYDAEFQEFLNEDMKQRNKQSMMSKTIATQGTLSRDPEQADKGKKVRPMTCHIPAKSQSHFKNIQVSVSKN